ncbi:MAG TPA: hypothetical protein VE090_03770 [Methylomirabilota bacterium]|nr:hypothetical protein [Methylomirabilota bacterium]
MTSKDFFIRNLEAKSYRENFFIAAIVTLFIIRIFLKLTHYPQLGTGALHIAHIVWGGFFMTAALIILLSFLNKAAANIASILGGIGFGLFIDELGKFVSRDNDYFFRPTIALIYIIFVLLYLISKFIPRYRTVSRKEYLVNAIEMLKESAINDFDAEEKQMAKEYLNRCNPKNPIVRALTELLSRLDTIPVGKPNIITKLRALARRWYYRVARSGIIINGVIVFLAFQVVRVLLSVVPLVIEKPVLTFDEWGKLLSSILAGAFIVIGFFALRFSKVEAYRFFRIALLLTLLLTDFFAFMRAQWLEVFGVIANIFVLFVINYAQGLEREKSK